MRMTRTGHCLCGAVRIEATVKPGLLACHCLQCQRWTGGGPLLSAHALEVAITGEDRVAAYHASAWGERAFCGTCGTTLYWKMQAGAVDSVAVGGLDDQSGLSVTKEIFVDYRPDWFPVFEGARQMTEAEVMAQYQGNSSDADA
jgi:hypothetical protein